MIYGTTNNATEELLLKEVTEDVVSSNEAYRGFVHPGKCAICMETFCVGCKPCLRSASGCPCPCKTQDICNKCLCTHAKHTLKICTCGCGEGSVQCPVCRIVVGVLKEKVDWIEKTIQHFGL